MSPRQTKLLLRSLSAALLLGSLIAVGWAVWPAAVDPQPAAASRSSSRKPAEIINSPGLEELAAVWDKRLQGPLYEQPAAAAPLPGETEDATIVQPAAGATEGGVTLVGTMREEGKSLAIFLHPDGQIDLRQAGESIELPEGNMRVERIESGQVTLTGAARSLTLRLPELGVQ